MTDTSPVQNPPATDPNAQNPPATDPNAQNPPVTDPNAQNPPVTDPNAQNPPVTESNPPVADPPVTDPPTTDPNAQNPPVADPPVTDPPTTDPNAPVTDPNAQDPPVTDPVVTDVIITDPTDTKDPPPPPMPEFIDIDAEPETWIPPPTTYQTKYGVVYRWDTQAQGLRISNVKDWDLLKLILDNNYNGVRSWNNDVLVYSPVTYDSYISIKLTLDTYANLAAPSIFGDNFRTAFVNGTVQISSGTSYISAPTLNIQTSKPGLYVVHWYVEVLIPEGAVEVLVLANGTKKLSNTTYGQSSDANDWRTISGFAVETFPAGNAGVKLAYKYIDVDNSGAIPTQAATARNAKLMFYQVGRV